MILFYDITARALCTLLVFNVSCFLLNPAVAAEIKTKAIKAPVSGISKVQSPGISSGGAKAETTDKAEQRQPSTLQHRDRAVRKEDYKNLGNKSPGINVNKQLPKPISSTQNKILKQNNKTPIGEKSGHNNSNYEPLKSSGISYTPSLGEKQWSDYSTHDPGSTIVNPKLRQSRNINEIKFGDGRNGSRLPPAKNSNMPPFKSDNKPPAIDTRRGLNSGIDSGLRRNDGVNNIQRSGNIIQKPLATGFTRQPAAGETTKVTGNQTVTKTRTIKAGRLIVKAHVTNKRIRTQPLIVKGI